MKPLSRDIVAIVRLSNYDKAPEVAEALVAGGISVIEFTLTGSGALNGLKRAKDLLKDTVSLGIGSVRSVDEAKESIDGGAEFLVTPVCIPEILKVTDDTPVAMGAYTPTEAFRAHEAGARYVKIFPARALGPQYIKDILAPLPFLKLVPTGGIDATNLKSFLDAGAVAVGVGGNLIPQKLVDEDRFDELREIAKTYVAALG